MAMILIWDETIVLPQSKIGVQVVYARRHGNEWFLAVMNGIHEKQTLLIDLSFLGRGQHVLHAIKDDETKQDSGIPYDIEVNSKSNLTVNLNPEGGFIGRFEKVIE
ncbi:MAG: glycoside hydrolase family 97 C-terminal domain-containing protein [Prolixibacteraceae bacterium]|jgi:alpha-glucosidase|nr:glycoside hydrolase family 97 C-terminal domain-containing protein [Prolixibacteraceae bacterium]